MVSHVPKYLSEMGTNTYPAVLCSALTSHLNFNPTNIHFAFHMTLKLKNALTFPIRSMP